MYNPKWRAKVTTIEESKDLSSLALDELIGNLKVHEVVMEKDSKIYKGKNERHKPIALKANKESSDDETLTSGSDDENMLWTDERKGKSDRKCFRFGDPNHLIGDCLKPSRNNDQKAFVPFHLSFADTSDNLLVNVFEVSSWRSARVDVRTYLLGGAIDSSEANGIIRDPKLELESSRFTFDLVPLSYESVDVVVGENWLLRHKAEMVCHEKVVKMPCYHCKQWTESKSAGFKQQTQGMMLHVDVARQQNTEQPEFNNEGKVDQNAEQCQDICPLPAKLTDDKTPELSNQSLESENVCLKTTVAQCNRSILQRKDLELVAKKKDIGRNQGLQASSLHHNDTSDITVQNSEFQDTA
ncbi:hypothetical protein Tco_0032059 [Tanacetum coccineum]